ncbi:aminotransferase, partial [Pediococcus pentosaceus]
SSKKQQASSTLTAMKIDSTISTSAVRVSLDSANSLEEADEFNRIFDQLYQDFSKINKNN